MKQRNNAGKTESESSRRKFLKKIVYTTPTLTVLGQLAKPGQVRADPSGDPAGPPGGWTP